MPVVYVSFGTEAIPLPQHLNAVIDGVLSSGHRLLMAVRQDIMEYLNITKKEDLISRRTRQID